MEIGVVCNSWGGGIYSIFSLCRICLFFFLWVDRSVLVLSGSGKNC